MSEPVNTLKSAQLPTASAGNAVQVATQTSGRCVTVIIAAWRADRTIARAVASALAQPETAAVIVVDDASADAGATLAAARTADDGSGRLSITALTANGGPAAARNAALAACRSAWICVLDSDDFMTAGRLAALLAASNGYDLVADDLLQTRDADDPAARRPLWFGAAVPTSAAPMDVSLAYFLQANLPDPRRPRGELGFLKPLMRRDFLNRHRLAYDESMRLGEDFDLYARALVAGAKFRLIAAAGYVAVLRPGSLSGAQDRRALAACDASDQRLLATPGLAAEESRLLRVHRQTIAQKLAWIDFMAALKSRRLLPAAANMLRSPQSMAYIVSGLTRIVLRRLGAGAAQS